VGVHVEVIVADNASGDDTVKLIQTQFPDIVLIQNPKNVGFSVATNQCIMASRGELILLLNPDTILQTNSLLRLLEFTKNNPEVGIVGPKVLNEDGSFQPQCKRGQQTPLSAFMHLTGIGYKFPRLPSATEYLLSHLSADEPHRVTAVSGSCLMIRRSVVERIGLLDEAIFGFGEDVDWCVRATNAGWQVWYCPKSVITHLKGQGGTHSQPYLKTWALHQAMWVFYNKHLRQNYNMLTTLAFWGMLKCSLVLRYVQLWRVHQMRKLLGTR
jgi:hypothetical protein